MMVLAADACAFPSFGGEHVGVAGVGVAPAQVRMQGAGERDVVGVLRVGQHEGAQRPEVHLDGIGPGGVGRGEAQLDLVSRRPPADPGALVRRQVVQDHVDG